MSTFYHDVAHKEYYKTANKKKKCQCVVRFLCQNNIKTFKGGIYDANERTATPVIQVASPFLI